MGVKARVVSNPKTWVDIEPLYPSEGFSQVANSLINSDLSDGAFRAFCKLLARFKKQTAISLTFKDAANLFGCSSKQAERYLQELETAGHICKTSSGTKRGQYVIKTVITYGRRLKVVE